MLSIGEKKEDLYEADGTLKPFYREVRGDTAFINIGYQDHGCAFHIIYVDELNEKQTEKKGASRKKKSSKKKPTEEPVSLFFDRKTTEIKPAIIF